MIYAIFTFVTFNWPIKVIQGPRLWCILLKGNSKHFCLHAPCAYRSNRSSRYARFSLCHVEMTTSRSSKVKLFCGLWSPISTSQQCYIETRLCYLAPVRRYRWFSHIRDPQMASKVIQSQRSWCILLSGQRWTFLPTGTSGLVATVKMLC